MNDTVTLDTKGGIAPESLAIRWREDRLELLDQRLLPHREEWLACRGAGDTADAIRHMVVRGAPAIGITAAYGLALAARAAGEDASADTLAPALAELAGSRPTAVNLFRALERMKALLDEAEGIALGERLLAEAHAIHEEDLRLNRTLAEHGARLLPAAARVYTHCNTGSLATGGHGTALGVLRTAFEQGGLEQVYAGETRPWLQGSRLTTWELMREGIPVTLVTDSCAAELMRQGRVNAVIVGADRVTANGDVANKIGTYSLAVLARHHDLPFIVAAPCSTLDLSLPDGSRIDIEERHADEIRDFRGAPLAPAGCEVFNPAFDITPATLVTALVTERGVVHHPDKARIARHMEPNHG